MDHIRRVGFSLLFYCTKNCIHNERRKGKQNHYFKLIHTNEYCEYKINIQHLALRETFKV